MKFFTKTFRHSSNKYEELLEIVEYRFLGIIYYTQTIVDDDDDFTKMLIKRIIKEELIKAVRDAKLTVSE